MKSLYPGSPQTVVDDVFYEYQYRVTKRPRGWIGNERPRDVVCKLSPAAREQELAAFRAFETQGLWTILKAGQTTIEVEIADAYLLHDDKWTSAATDAPRLMPEGSRAGFDARVNINPETSDRVNINSETSNKVNNAGNGGAAPLKGPRSPARPTLAALADTNSAVVLERLILNHRDDFEPACRLSEDEGLRALVSLKGDRQVIENAYRAAQALYDAGEWPRVMDLGNVRHGIEELAAMIVGCQSHT
jgi:hypothetical protein